MRFLVLFLISFELLVAQKVVKKTISSSAIGYVKIDASNCYQIDVITSKEKDLIVEASIEGEYRDDLWVTIEEDGENLLIDAGFQPSFSNPNDKLSAHKVVSIALKISVPEYNLVHLFGTNCNANFEGNYKQLKVDLDDGDCFLKEVGENSMVRTQAGTITIESSNGSVVSSSNYGKIVEEELPVGDNIYNLTTVEGNIYIRKNQ